MRSTLFFIIFSLQTGFVFSQNADSLLAVRQVDSLIQVSRDLTEKKKYDMALELNAAAEKTALEKLGRESAAYASCCFNRGRVTKFMGNNPEGEKWYLESIAIREKVLGKEHKDYALSLNNLAILYRGIGDYRKAEPLFLEIIAIRERVLGKEHKDYASSLNSLANLYGDKGDLEKAEPLYLEAMAIREKILGKEHKDYASSLNNLAILYLGMVKNEKAEPLFIEAIAIREKVLGKEHPDYASSLSNLGILYLHMGSYEKAEPLYLETIAILEKTLGKEGPDYAGGLINLASLYSSMGNHEKALSLYLEAKEIFEVRLNNFGHPFYHSCIHNLARLYFFTGEYGKAEHLFLEHKSLVEKASGKESFDYARSLAGLGVVYMELGNYEKAEAHCLESQAIHEKISAKENFDYVLGQHTLASLYWHKGNFEKAEPLFLEAKATWEKVLGKEHPDYQMALINLANMYEQQNRPSESETLLYENFALSKANLVKSATFLSEGELASYATDFKKDWDFLSTWLLTRQAKNEPTGALSALDFEQALFQKGFLLTAVARLNAPTSASPKSVEINNRLKGYRRRLAAEYANPIAERKGIAELEEKANATEKELARTVSGYVENARQVKWQEVQSALQDDEVAIEFIHFRVNFPKATDSVMYAALILKKGSTQPVFVPLFEEKTLAAFLSRGLATGGRKSGYVNQIYGLQNPDGKTLYQLVWQPLESELAGAKKVYFSPSGLLHQLKLGAIPVSKNEVLADRFRFVQLGSTRQLAVNQSLATNSGSGATERSGQAVLFGGIQFDMDENAISKANADFSARNLDGTSRGLGSELDFSKTDSLARCLSRAGMGGDWSFLDWTEKEVTTLDPILASAGMETAVFKGFSATEEAFKTLKSPRILHIATHGYFFPDPKTADGGRQTANGTGPIFKMSDHPMIRSGLILAGGNHAWKNGSPLKPGMEDGILTAYEISQMDLSETELVVLSACETGLGEIQGSEGVYGLQRAFKIAGVKHLLMSLWQVPDFQTQELMTVFYQKYLKDKMPLPEAFRAAQNEIRKKYLHPYFWAGFVLVE